MFFCHTGRIVPRYRKPTVKLQWQERHPALPNENRKSGWGPEEC
ncbi:hypothetical protein EVA_05021 [gut metagenome]|uniref:Uncharacterized protein n=1 Tax=gut metagenome TaxID=749906 RepID=J9GVE3_9ZZZZ